MGLKAAEHQLLSWGGYCAAGLNCLHGSLNKPACAAGVEEWATYGPVSHNFSGHSLNAGASALKYCERHFGDAWLDHWLHRATYLCSAQSSVRCRFAPCGEVFT